MLMGSSKELGISSEDSTLSSDMVADFNQQNLILPAQGSIISKIGMKKFDRLMDVFEQELEEKQHNYK